MGSKIKTLAVALLLFASFMGGVNSTFAASTDVVRVGLTDNKFQNVLKQTITIYGTAECDICDRESRKIISRVPANGEVTIKNGITGLDVTINGRTATLRDFVVICPQGVLGVKDLTRKGKPALYHGAFEVVQKEDRKSQNINLQNFKK